MPRQEGTTCVVCGLGGGKHFLHCGGANRTLEEWVTSALHPSKGRQQSEYINDTGRLEIVIQEAAEAICDAIDSFANRMCEHPGVDE